jgi:hypothetical protein
VPIMVPTTIAAAAQAPSPRINSRRCGGFVSAEMAINFSFGP